MIRVKTTKYMAVIGLAMILTGCTSNKAEETEAITEAAITAALITENVVLDEWQDNSKEVERFKRLYLTGYPEKNIGEALAEVGVVIEWKYKQEDLKNYVRCEYVYQDKRRSLILYEDEYDNVNVSEYFIDEVRQGKEEIQECCADLFGVQEDNEDIEEVFQEEQAVVGEETLWNGKKASDLRAFMATWGNIMGQEYEEYTPERNVSFYGLPLPEGILERQMVPAIDNQEIAISWSEDGESGSDYKIVAVYSNAETADYLECYCYLFTIHNGNPVVLVTSQNQGGLPGNHIVFRETENQMLKDGYSNIIKMNSSVFDIMPDQFVFSSGAGAWGTYINLGNDGSFTGQYHDSNMGESGENYPAGTTYICDFSGSFSEPKKIDDYTYSMTLSSFETQGNPGEEYYDNGIRYVYSDPYGFDKAENFLIYLPGCPIENIAEGFLSWAYLDRDTTKVLPADYYGIYNVNGEMGFVGVFENSNGY